MKYWVGASVVNSNTKVYTKQIGKIGREMVLRYFIDGGGNMSRPTSSRPRGRMCHTHSVWGRGSALPASRPRWARRPPGQSFSV